MDENLHELDDLFREALDEHEEAPSARVWEQLEKHLEKKRVVFITQKYQRWKWVAAALFIFSVGMAMYTVNLKLSYKQDVKGNSVATTTKSSRNKHASSNRISRDPIADSVLTDLAARKKIEKMHGLVTKVPIKVNKVFIATESLKNRSLSREEKLERNVEAVSNASNWSRTNKKVAKIGREGKLLSASAILGKGTVGVNTKPNYGVDLTVPSTKQKLEIGLTELKLERTQPGINTMALNGMNAALANVKQKSRKGLSVEVYASKDYLTNDLKNDRSDFREDDRRQIKSTEKMSDAYTLGITVGKSIFKNLGIFSGLSLSSRSSNINNKRMFARADGRGHINYRISSSFGYAYFATITGAQPLAGDSILSLSSKTSLQYLTVPIGLQYHLSLNKFSLNPGIALITNFKTKAEVSSVLQPSNLIETTTSRDVVGLKNVYFDAAVKVDLGYNFTSNIGIVVAPSWRLALSSATEGGPVKTYVNSMSLGVGMNFNF